MIPNERLLRLRDLSRAFLAEPSTNLPSAVLVDREACGDAWEALRLCAAGEYADAAIASGFSAVRVCAASGTFAGGMTIDIGCAP